MGKRKKIVKYLYIYDDDRDGDGARDLPPASLSLFDTLNLPLASRQVGVS